MEFLIFLQGVGFLCQSLVVALFQAKPKWCLVVESKKTKHVDWLLVADHDKFPEHFETEVFVINFAIALIKASLVETAWNE